MTSARRTFAKLIAVIVLCMAGAFIGFNLCQPSTKDIARIRLGMRYDEVVAIFGNPTISMAIADTGCMSSYWDVSGGTVNIGFSEDRRVLGRSVDEYAWYDKWIVWFRLKTGLGI